MYRYLIAELLPIYGEPEAKALSRHLLSFYLQVEPSQLSLQFDSYLSESLILKINNAKKKLVKQIPLQYITRVAWFDNRAFTVNENVLIPRQETEELLNWIKESFKKQAPASILDIGTGSGCLAISLALCFPNAEVWGLDSSQTAIELAIINADHHNCRLSFLGGDILQSSNFHGLPSEIDVIVSNPPYVRESEKSLMKANVLDHEPAIALFVPDSDPLLFYRAIATFARKKLAKNGLLFLEINEALGVETQELIFSMGFGSEIRKDIFDKNRMIKAWLC
jgi:release factor glutamine methyltransferase